MSAHSPQPPRHVALTHPIAVPWMALFMRGVMDYAKQHGEWSFAVSSPALDSATEEPLTLQNLKDWRGDGVIATVTNEADLQAARQLGKPVVNIAATMADVELPTVTSDNYEMGRLAADHLLKLGLNRLAYFGVQGVWYSQQRRDGFRDCARQAGAACDVLEIPAASAGWKTWQERTSPLTCWLKKLSPPVGLLAMQDYSAWLVLDECQRLGIDVPHEIALMGIDNDPTICEFCLPTLTSVSRNPWRMGHEAAALLDRLMNGKSPPKDKILIPPAGIAPRQSTDTVAVENANVASAVRYIHEHLRKHFSVEEVVQATAISRRRLEMQFRIALKCSIYDYICQRRCEEAKKLLAVADGMKFREIARACGFSSMERMRLVFLRFTGMTPQQYRAGELGKES